MQMESLFKIVAIFALFQGCITDISAEERREWNEQVLEFTYEVSNNQEDIQKELKEILWNK